MLAAVASQAAIAIQNASMHESLLERERLNRDLKLAEQVQKRFLPQSVPTIPGFEFFAHYHPTYEVGGDYYDFVPLPDDRLAIAVGDVSGKGVAAALMMAKFSGDTRYCILTENAPAAAANELNSLLFAAGHRGEVHHAQPERARRREADPDPDLGRSPPGADPPGQRHVEEVGEEIAGFPLGIIPEADYQQTEVKLYPGDVVVIFSDGVTDARNLREELYDSRENRRLLRKFAETREGPRPSAGRSSRTSASSPPDTSRSTTSP